MNTLTQTQTVSPAFAQATIPIQKGAASRCFTGGAPAQGLRTWAEMPKWDGYSPLDEWGITRICKENSKDAARGVENCAAAFGQFAEGVGHE